MNQHIYERHNCIYAGEWAILGASWAPVNRSGAGLGLGLEALTHGELGRGLGDQGPSQPIAEVFNQQILHTMTKRSWP